MQADSRTRPTAVAGLFYPSDPDLLRTQVLDLLADVAVSQSMPKALIAPHAGYAYSGRVAAAAFATLRDSAHSQIPFPANSNQYRFNNEFLINQKL
jgi:AmmeMemoRadiSam system protein B